MASVLYSLTRLIVAATTCFVVLWWLPGSARAQYYPANHEDIRLVPVTDSKALGIMRADPRVFEAGEISQIKVDGLFRVAEGMMRYFPLSWSAESEEFLAEEFVILPLKQPTGDRASATEPVSYGFDGGQLLIGFGQIQGELDYYPYLVACYLSKPGEPLVELSRWEVAGPYCRGVYAMDLNADGVIELAVPWATGVGSGGGVDLLAVVPTGGLATFGPNPADSTFVSNHGDITLVDYNADGCWELEVSGAVLCSACGYYFHGLLQFDEAQWNWVHVTFDVPELYATDWDFYRRFLEMAREYAADPARFQTGSEDYIGGFACELDGELRSLWPIAMEDGGVDAIWLETLDELVSSFPRATE